MLLIAQSRAEVWRDLSIVVSSMRSYATPARPPRKSRFPETVSLERFLLRQKVLGLYRRIIRETRPIPDPKTRRETIEEAKREFVRNKAVDDASKIKYLVETGKVEWDGMSRYIVGL